MEITTTTTNERGGRRAAIGALAIVGFIALLIIGIGLAIYGARYMPLAVSKIGTAAVSLSSSFQSADENPELDVVTTATTTLPLEDSVVITASDDEDADEDSDDTGRGNGGTATGAVRTETRTVVTTVPVEPYGDPDLTVRITDTGYLSRNDTDDFVASSRVPDNKQGAVKFTVTNTGTNVTGSWKFKVEIPTSPSYTYTSNTQRSLKPGDRIDFVLGFTKGREGDNREITVTVDTGRDVRESNEGNNSDSARIDIRD